MKKNKPYLSKSRNARNKAYISIKNKIRIDRWQNGGLFYSHDYLEEGCDWVDFYFLGAKSTIFYNACLVTARHALYEKVGDVARSNAEKLVPRSITLRPRSQQPTKNFYSMNEVFIDSDDTADLTPFDPLSRREWCKKEEIRLATEERIVVNEHIYLKHDYSFGIGLEGVIDTPVITKDVLDIFIKEFLAHGEQGDMGKECVATVDMMDISTHRLSNAILL